MADRQRDNLALSRVLTKVFIKVEQMKDYKGNATGLFTGIVVKKKNKDIPELQNIDSSKIGFFLKRQSLTPEYLLSLGDDTTYQVLGDSIDMGDKSRHYLFCKCKECGHYRNVQVSDLKVKKVNCEMCFKNRLVDEAAKFGLELQGASTDGDNKRRNYRFTSCGHFRNIATGDVRDGQFTCTECSHNEFVEACTANNLTYISKAIDDGRYNKGEFRYVRFNACGHEKNISRMRLLNGGKPHCNICEEVELTSYAKSLGMTFVKYVGNTRRLFIIDKCGHEKTLGLSNLKAGSVYCEPCAVDRFKQEAKESGLEYIGDCASKDRRLYKTPCGCINEYRICHVRIGHWTCRTCEKGFRDYPNNIYLYRLKSGSFEWLKLGHGKNPNKRKYDYSLADGVCIELVTMLEVSTGKFAEDTEKALHRKYKKFNIDKTFMKQFMTESGFTETYPIELLDTLISEIENIKELNGN